MLYLLGGFAILCGLLLLGYLFVFEPLQEKREEAQTLQRSIDDLESKENVILKAAPRLVEAKRASRNAATPEERRHAEAVQQSFKILINAFYGYLAFGTGHWNDFQAADRVTQEGRAVVTAIIDALTSAGAMPVEACVSQIVSALQANGYDGVVSIEHEDPLLSIDEGFAKAVELLQRILPRESVG